MLIFQIYNNFETDGHCRDQEDFYLLKTIISFNSGKIKMKNSYNYYHITMNNLSVPVVRCRTVTVPTSTGKSQKKGSMHGTEFDKIMEFCEMICAFDCLFSGYW